jgi:hypothetical protein
LRSHLTQGSLVVLAFERGNFLGAGLAACVRHAITANLIPAGAGVASGGNPIAIARAGGLSAARHAGLIAFDRTLHRRIETPVAAGLAAIPAVASALVDVSVRRRIQVASAAR